MGVLDTIKQASRARRTVELILDAALDDEWQSLNNKLVDAADKDVATASLAEPGSLARPATTAIVDRMEEIRDRVEASRVQFVFEQIDWAERVALQSKHSPREGNALDRLNGYNIETFTPAVIRRACLGAYEGELNPEAEPEPLTDEVWDGLFAKLSYGQVDRLYSAALVTQDGVARVPTSARSLLGTQDSGASLAQPSPGADRAPSDSKGGNRRTSRSSSTTKKVASSGP